MLPLDDLLVLDFSTLLPGPLASLFLSEAGARVVKLERPGGEDMRGFPPRFGETAAPFAVLNRGKQSVEIDLKARDSLERLKPLIVEADILIEQFRPGVMERLGFGYETLKALNPRLIYCSISGYGQDGPYAEFPAYDDLIQGAIGLPTLIGRIGDGVPARVSMPATIGTIGSTQGVNASSKPKPAKVRSNGSQACVIDGSRSDPPLVGAAEPSAAGGVGQSICGTDRAASATVTLPVIRSACAVTGG